MTDDHLLSGRPSWTAELTRLGPRWPAAGALLLAEYLVISLRVDAHSLAGREVYGFEYLGSVATVVLVMVVATVLVRGRSLIGDLARVRATSVGVGAGALLALHFASYGALYFLSVSIFDTGPGARTGGGWLLAWLGAAFAVVATMAPLVVAPARLGGLLRTLTPALTLGLLAGVLGVASGRASAELWDFVGHYTLDASEYWLRLAVPEVVHMPDEMIFGTPEFLVYLAPACSGFEGMGLIFALLSGYIFVYRRVLRFPNVLFIVPVAVLVVWVANSARIALLVLLGSWWSPEVAVGGFHSKAGWVVFCAIAIAAVAIMRTSPAFSREPAEGPASGPRPVTHDVAAPYLVPLLSLTAVSLLTGLFTVAVDYLYGLRIAGALLALWAYRGVHLGRAHMPDLITVTIGAAVYALWAAMVPGTSDAGLVLQAEIGALDTMPAAAWIAVRVLGSTLVVPAVEELAFRGYLLPRLVSARFESVDLQRLHWVAMPVSSLAFGVLHGAWLAGTLAGVAYALAQQRRGYTSDAVVAHAITNGLISAQVLGLGHWGLWA